MTPSVCKQMGMKYCAILHISPDVTSSFIHLFRHMHKSRREGTTRDQPTNQFDISIKVSAPFYLDPSTRGRENALLFFTIYFLNNNIYNFVYSILLSSLMLVYFSREIA